MAMILTRKVPDKSRGTRVERVNPITGKRELVNPETGQAEGWPLLGLKLQHVKSGQERQAVAAVRDGEPIPPRLVEDSPPDEFGISMTRITGDAARDQEGLVQEGLAVLIGERVVTCPAGPKDDPWKGGHFSAAGRKNHDFVQCDAIVFKTIDGDVRYDVVRNPGKYYESDGKLVNDDMSRYGEPARVSWDYKLVRAH